MSPVDAEATLAWLLANHKSTDLATIYAKLQSTLGQHFAEEDIDIEKGLSGLLGRPLSEQERFRLRPIAMKIYANYYGEE